MNLEQAAQLAQRIALDAQRGGFDPIVMLAMVDDETGLTYLALYRPSNLEHLGRLYSAEHYEAIARQAHRIVASAVSLN